MICDTCRMLREVFDNRSFGFMDYHCKYWDEMTDEQWEDVQDGKCPYRISAIVRGNDSDTTHN